MEKYRRSPVKDYVSVANFAGEEDFDVPQPDIVAMKKDFEYMDRTVQDAI